LQIAPGFVGNCAPCGLSPQIDGMPVIQIKECLVMCEAFFLLTIIISQMHRKCKAQDHMETEVKTRFHMKCETGIYIPLWGEDFGIYPV
jgi:hypothetical protein